MAKAQNPKPEQAEEPKAEPKVVTFGDPKDAVVVKAKKNIPLAMICRGNPELMRDHKVKIGGRVERGTDIKVPKVVAERLKAAKYA